MASSSSDFSGNWNPDQDFSSEGLGFEGEGKIVEVDFGFFISKLATLSHRLCQGQSGKIHRCCVGPEGTPKIYSLLIALRKFFELSSTNTVLRLLSIAKRTVVLGLSLPTIS